MPNTFNRVMRYGGCVAYLPAIVSCTFVASPLDAGSKMDAATVMPVARETAAPSRPPARVPPLRLEDGGLAIPEPSPLPSDPPATGSPAMNAIPRQMPTEDAAVARAGDAGWADAGPAAPDTAGERTPSLDAGAPPRSSSPLPCEGAAALELCWYLGESGQSCTQACEQHGGFDMRSTQYVGTSSQGGSLDACALVLAALGQSGAQPASSLRFDVGLGCHLWNDSPYWLDDPSPDFSPLASMTGDSVRIVCACLR